MEPEIRHKPIRYLEIDLLRFIAALSVVLYHYTYQGYAAYQDPITKVTPIPFLELAPITKYGYMGVELFFIISGYVILLSATGKNLGNFLSRVLFDYTRLFGQPAP